jgi:alpha-L-rhamnosidase
LNRLHEAAVWSLRGNVCDIPTDCPTRERAGWTGDWQLYAPVAAFMYDVAGFSAKWLRDLAAEQEPDGLVHDCVPNPAPDEVLRAIGIAEGSAGWGDAAVIVPWEIYRAYGDARLLEEQWPSMVAWVENRARAASERRHLSRTVARPEPAPHKAFLLDTGFHFGEWLEPDEFASGFGDGFVDDMAARGAADSADVATAYLHRSASLLAEIAAVLGDRDEARYRELAAATRAAWQAEFVLPDGSLARDTQANHVRALAFRLVPDELRSRTAERLVELVRRAGTHVGTGFLATPYLLGALADSGHLDVAYELLLRDTEPSWLTMLDRGATTIWELWNGIDADGIARGSLNHYSKGAVISFLHSSVAGIRVLEPAYRRFRIAPQPGGGIRWARAVHDSPYGRIESSWRIEGEAFRLEVVVPPGTSAEVLLPDGRRLEAQAGTATYRGGR